MGISQPIYTGPQDMEKLRGALSEGWEVEPDEYGLTFSYPYPYSEARRIILAGSRAASLLLNPRNDQDCLAGDENRDSNEEGQSVRIFTVMTDWPVYPYFMVVLDGVANEIEKDT